MLEEPPFSTNHDRSIIKQKSAKTFFSPSLLLFCESKKNYSLVLNETFQKDFTQNLRTFSERMKKIDPVEKKL